MQSSVLKSFACFLSLMLAEAFVPSWRTTKLATRLFAEGEFSCSRIEVCSGSTSKDCKRRGSVKTLEYFRNMVGDTGIEIIQSECMDECTSGPNIRLDGDDKRIYGGIKGPVKIAEVLGVEMNEDN